MVKRKTGLAIGLAAVCIAVLCAAGASNEITKGEKTVYRLNPEFCVNSKQHIKESRNL